MFRIAHCSSLPISDALNHLLVELTAPFIEKRYDYQSPTALTLNFRNPEYTAEAGGYRPVEIRIELNDHKIGHISYITEFQYVGAGWYAELTKSVDFDVQAEQFLLQGSRYLPLSDAAEFYRLWEDNFLSYYQMGVFTVDLNIED